MWLSEWGSGFTDIDPWEHCRQHLDVGRNPQYRGYRSVRCSGVTVIIGSLESRCYRIVTDLCFYDTPGVMTSEPHDKGPFLVTSCIFSVGYLVSVGFTHERSRVLEGQTRILFTEVNFVTVWHEPKRSFRTPGKGDRLVRDTISNTYLSSCVRREDVWRQPCQ